MPDDVAIEVKDLHKSFILPHEKISSVKSVFTNFGLVKNRKYEKQHALKGVSFTVKKGEFFGIVGRNGSGKSTLLKLLAGIYQPTKGSIKTNGKIVPFIELGVGFNPDLSGRDNVYLNGAMLGFSDKEIDEKYKDIVEFAELERFMDQKLKNYSSGMQVRLAFSVATILAESDILLLDEVLAVGDADFQRKCFSYFKTLKKLKKTVIFVSHDMNAISQFCDRAMLVNKGVIDTIGDVDRVAFEYTNLFAQEGQATINHDGSASGSSSIKNLDVKTGKNVTISGTVVPQFKLDEPLLGFIIKDAAGQPIIGFNSQMIRRSLGILPKGRAFDFTWRFPNVLSDGDYTVDIALVGEDGVSIIDWWKEALSMTVKKIIVSPYPLTPDITLTFKEKK